MKHLREHVDHVVALPQRIGEPLGFGQQLLDPLRVFGKNLRAREPEMAGRDDG